MIKPILKDSYMAVIKNSVNSNSFRNFFAEVDGVKKDILEDGNISCAFFVSNVLHMFSGLSKLISNPHVTINSTIKDMLENGWEKTEELKIGAILHWEKRDFGKTGFHEHVGFYIGDNLAISNNDKFGYPTEHNYNFDGERKVVAIYFHKSLD